MGKLALTPQWHDDITQIEKGDMVLGGPNGMVNKPTQQVAENVLFLKNHLEDLSKSTVLGFGAVGDGITDDTDALMQAIKYACENKIPLDGGGLTYACNNVQFDSNLKFSNAFLVCNKYDSDLISVLTTDESDAWLENVELSNIKINGKRELHTDIKKASTAEDGGRHGFRFVRKCRNIKLDNCVATNCASDGIIFYPKSGSGNDRIVDVVLSDCDFSGNRRHGGSSDSVKGITFTRVKCNNNGLDIDANAAADSGLRGDTVNGYKYGNGWDSEEYADDVLSHEMLFDNCEMLNNARSGLLILATKNAITPPFDTNIKILGGKYNAGLYPDAGIDIGIIITPNGTTNPNNVFKNTIIDSVTCGRQILLRNNLDFVVTNTPAIVVPAEKSKGLVDGCVTVAESAGKTYSYFSTPTAKFFYDEDDDTLKSFISANRHHSFDSKIFHRQDYYFGFTEYRGSFIASIDQNLGYVNFNIVDNNGNVVSTWKGDGSFIPGYTATASLGVEDKRYAHAFINDIHLKPQSSINPGENGEMVFELTSDNQLKIKVKGSDGVTRSTSLSLT